MHDSTSVGHLILIGVLRVVVIVNGVNNAKVKEKPILILRKKSFHVIDFFK